MLHNISADASLIRYRIYCRSIEHTKIAVGLSAIIFIFILLLSMTISKTATLDYVDNKTAQEDNTIGDEIHDPEIPALSVCGYAGLGMLGLLSTEKPGGVTEPASYLETDKNNFISKSETITEESISVSISEISAGTPAFPDLSGSEAEIENSEILPADTNESNTNTDPSSSFIFDTSIRDGISVYDTKYSFQISYPKGIVVTECKVYVNGRETGVWEDSLWTVDLLPNQSNDILIKVSYKSSDGEILSVSKTYNVPTIISPMELVTNLAEPEDGLYTREKYEFYAYGVRNDREYTVEVYLRDKLLAPESDGKTYIAKMTDGDNIIRIRMLWDGEVIEEREVLILCWIMPEAEAVFYSPMGEGTVTDPEYVFTYIVRNVDTFEPVPSVVYLNNELLSCSEDGSYHVLLKPGDNVIRINWYSSDGESFSEAKGVTYIPE